MGFKSLSALRPSLGTDGADKTLIRPVTLSFNIIDATEFVNNASAIKHKRVNISDAFS